MWFRFCPSPHVLLLIIFVGLSSVLGRKAGFLPDKNLQALTEELWRLEMESLPQPDLVISVQSKTSQSKGDVSPARLIQNVSSEYLEKPSVAAFRKLFDNYDPEVLHREQETLLELIEVGQFLDALLATPVMRLLQEHCRQSGRARNPQEFKDLLKNLWFTIYPRRQRTPSSSGFEHVFLGELRDSLVIGLHNWIRFYYQEAAGEIDYYGWIHNLYIQPPKSILKQRFSWMQYQKLAASTMFLGTSPEFEMALYTLCFLERHGDCQVSLNGKTVTIKTHAFFYDGRTYVATTYPA